MIEVIVHRAALLGVGMFALGLDAFVLAGVLPGIAADLRAPVGDTGFVVTGFTLAYALLSPVLAAATAGWDRRRVLLGALVLFTAANVASALAPSLPVLLGTRVAAGVGAGLYAPAAAAAAGLVEPQRRGRALALVTGGLQAATVAGVPLGTVVGNAFGWRATMGLVVATGLAAVVLLAATLPRLDLPAPPPLRERVALLAERPVLRWLAVMVLASVASLGLYTFLSPVLGAVAGITPDELPLYLLVWGSSLVAGNVLVSHVVDRGVPVRVLLPAVFALLTVTAGLLTVADGRIAAALVLVGFGLACGSGQVPLQHRLLATTGARGPVALSLLASALYLGSAVGSGVGGVVLTASDARWLPLVAMVAGLLALMGSVERRAAHGGREP